MNNTCRITGYVNVETFGPNKGEPKTTAKAVRVTVLELDGETFAADTTWLPRSLATGLVISEVREDDGGRSFEFSATVPTWWVRKSLDARPAWIRRGDRHAPMAQRPM